jgi:tRNA(Ile)-lysidine synthase
MINVLGSIPKKVAVAVSGGSDSMAVLDFLGRSNRDLLVLHFNHGTAFAPEAEAFVKNYCENRGIPLEVGTVARERASDESKEEYWRNERYAFFSNFLDRKIITCHHLDDAVETWLFTSIHGNPMLIPYSRDNFIRPFLTTRKVALSGWCNRKEVPFLEDPSNTDVAYMRNLIRHKLMENVLTINPGIHKVVKKKVKLMFENSIDII